ncbi:Putative F-box/FBD/LRR-repeat protein At3g49030 [Linum grandiflorum]
MKNEEAVSPAAAAVDRISELPDEILHLILRSLNTHEEAGRSSILSRRWLHLWSTYPVVDFRYHPEDKLTSFRFERFAAATSKRLQVVVPPFLLDTFNITLGYFFMDEWTKRDWLPCAKLLLQSGSNRSPLKVVLKNNLPNSSSSLDPIGLFMNCGRTRFLDLARFDLSRWGSSETCLDNLQELCLDDVQLAEESFPSRLASARRLEKLSLQRIRGIRILDICESNFPSLKSLSFRDSCLDGGVVLQLSSAQLLQTFRFEGNTKLLTVVSAPNVTSLELVPLGEIRREEFDELISKLPSLESLDFDARSVRCYNDPQFEIDAPNLVTLFIKSHHMLPININIVNVASSTLLCVVECSICELRLTTDWFVDLMKCLTALATRSRHLVFKLAFVSEYMMVDELDSSKVRCESSSPLVVKRLLLGIDLPSEPTFKDANYETRLLDGILSAFWPKKLLIAQPLQNCRITGLTNRIDLVLYMNEQMKKTDHPWCWRRRFRRAKITCVTVDDISTINKPMKSQPSVNILIKLPRDQRCL